MIHNLIKICLTLLLVCYHVECRRDKIKLKDIEVLTLEAGKWTTGRRSSSVPQLKCVAGMCHSFQPSVVQCYNRGTDGIDVQWECKAEMKNNLKFGKIEVTCEGYDYADDPYVLLGSCGLEYTIDSDSNYNANTAHNTYNHNPYQQNDLKLKNHFSFGHILAVIAIIFIIYYTCIRSPNRTGDRPSPQPHQPPPPGFRSNLYDDDCTGSSQQSSYQSDSQNRTHGGVNPGFWSGLMTGGTLGYLFGSSGTRTNYYRDRTSYWNTPSYGTSYPSYGASDSGSSSSTKTSSGFGGTKRR